jgi:hypothetical protein
MQKRLRHVLAWIALFATLLGTSAPAVTHLLAASRGENVALEDICTSTIPGHHPRDQSDPGSSHQGTCPFCFNHSVAHAPPPVEFHWQPRLIVAAQTPPVHPSAAVTTEKWTHPLSRGPPIA